MTDYPHIILTDEYLNAVNDKLNELMRARSLHQQVFAVLTAGASTTDANSAGSPSATSPDQSVKADVMLSIAGPRWGAPIKPKRWAGFSQLGADLGFMPALAMVSSGSDTTSDYVSAFVWDVNLKYGFNAGRYATPYLRAAGGQQIALSDAFVASSGEVATIVDTTGRAAWFWEVGGGFALFDAAWWALEAEQAGLLPSFDTSFSLRWDSRFKDLTVNGVESSKLRGVFRLSLNAVKVLDRRPASASPTPFTLSFGVEYQFGFDEDIASGTRIILSGDANLVKLFSGTP